MTVIYSMFITSFPHAKWKRTRLSDVEFEIDMLQPIIVKNGIGSLYESFRLAEKMKKKKNCLTLRIFQILKEIIDGFGQIDESSRIIGSECSGQKIGQFFLRHMTDKRFIW
jgi:hypothetical protein